ncbi:D-glycero-beta-D-manno-heptose 1,7-bisphosphate 7-phosphatase [Sulfurimonas sp.]|jgi:D-glycero-D-manno-heptose 1,7-bisphosphate phosphatase|uniref:D-glycero-beta-D-manno-heptose 1,7-bisphosphate 7-phosphatase n=1 Tax=Sulfurimonas sp. TaxID=2022749 RepID=UPI002A367DD7|nr:D-glycero-beta-D-manno-heptose 1,7-bisphosphate 7-phosphatase [Sulfurimonas sp.]MDY0123291.1 D-glycero-beta-D-manno-heptose 1,7-bisphosphate 7-phosphatase [Sulfurimonas sp.]
MKKALFLDRDGVINIELNYLYKIEDFKFIDGIFELCRHYQDLGYLIIVVTNQSGIARNYYDESDFEKLTTWMIEEFAKNGIKITKVYHCPHHPEISGKCSCRKPEPGMILEAQKEFDIDLKSSILVGDKERDIEAAIEAGICENYLFDEMRVHKKSKAIKIVSKLEDIYNADIK